MLWEKTDASEISCISWTTSSTGKRKRPTNKSRRASVLLKIAPGAREGIRVCQVHIYQQAGLKEIDDESIEKLK